VPSWATIKQTALVRDNGRCLLCGATEPLDVHHRRARGMGGTRVRDRLANVATLCRRCHDRIEAHPEQARALGYRLDAGDDPLAVAIWARTLMGTGWTLLDDDGAIRLLPGDHPGGIHRLQ